MIDTFLLRIDKSIERSKIWTTELELDRIHEVRERLNIPSLCLDDNSDHIERYDIMLLASVIRLYLMELPDCLVTCELYDPIKQLYSNRKSAGLEVV